MCEETDVIAISFYTAASAGEYEANATSPSNKHFTIPPIQQLLSGRLCSFPICYLPWVAKGWCMGTIRVERASRSRMILRFQGSCTRISTPARAFYSLLLLTLLVLSVSAQSILRVSAARQCTNRELETPFAWSSLRTGWWGAPLWDSLQWDILQLWSRL